MSRYADKQRKALCAQPRCERPGEQLKMIFGQLDWYCSEHAKLSTHSGAR